MSADTVDVFMSFGRSDLSIGVSKPKLDAGATAESKPDETHT